MPIHPSEYYQFNGGAPLDPEREEEIEAEYRAHVELEDSYGYMKKEDKEKPQAKMLFKILLAKNKIRVKLRGSR